MPKLVTATPKYRKHHAAGQAVVTICGKDFYLGPHGTKASRIEYDRLVTEWLAAGRPTTLATEEGHGTKIKELILAYTKWAKGYYRKDGESTGTLERMRPTLRLLREMYGDTSVADFRPLSIEALQRKMIDKGDARSYVNLQIGKIKRIFRWGVSKELVPVEVLQRLETVRGLTKGRTDAREAPPVLPVADDVVDATIPFLPPVVVDMVRFQRLTGARPTEVCILRPCDVNRDGEVWEYRPESHKTENYGRERIVYIGNQAQDVLRPYLLRDAGAYCFSPADSERKRLEERHANRKTPLSCGNRPGTNRKPNRKRPPAERYNKDS